MRRAEREIIDPDQIRAIFAAADVMRIAMVDANGEAYIVPLNYGWEETEGDLSLYFHCAREGRKVDILRQNPKVCFEIDTAHRLTTAEKPCGYSFAYQSVIGWGEVTFLSDSEEKSRGLQVLMRQFGMTDAQFSHNDTARVLVGKLRVDRMTAKKHD